MSYRIIGRLWRASPHWLRRGLIRTYQTTFTVSAAAVVVNSEKKVLILHHILRPATGWGLPGGFIDVNEQPSEAIVRELKEETGIDICDVRFLQMRTIGRHVEVLFSASADGEGEIRSREIDHLCWYSLSDIPDELPKHDRRMIEFVLNGEI